MNRCLHVLAAMLLFLAWAGHAQADLLYATSLEGQQIDSVNTSNGNVAKVFNSVGTADSLVFDLNNNILYTNLTSGGQVRMYNQTTKTDTVVAGGFNDPADLILEPGGKSILVSDFNAGTITRVDLTTHVKTTLGTYGGNPEGLAYDSSGRLYANLGVRDGGPDKFVAQLNPVTGAVLGTSNHESSLDGLTFDSFTGKLYAASVFGNLLYSVDPNTLVATPLPNSGVLNPDGITSDGKGNLFIASRGTFNVYRYNLTTDSLTSVANVFGLDDLAPASGLGAPNAAPEPASATLLALGLAGLTGYGWRRRKMKA